VDDERLDSLATKDLAMACAQRISYQRTPARAFAPCYELFRRALAPSPDNDAWQAILNQYHRLVLLWLGQYASEDTVQEVFLRFWKAQQGAMSPFASRFPNIRAVMGYLKRCAIVVRTEAWREEEGRRILWLRLCDAAQVELVLARAQPDHGHAGFHFNQLVLSRLKDDRERAVFEGTYYHDLAPREIQAERPDLFPDVRAVHRVKENLLKRLRRDQELEEYWANDYAEDDGDGGKTAGSPVY
jgi:DNA-directed RNA polymerase specialized sigma24 family protein